MQGREEVHGNLSHAMRDNYNEYGVDEYYRKVAATYRNPFFPSIKQVIWAIMNRWYEEEQGIGATVLDMAAGSGEVTTCLLEWEDSGRSSSSASATAVPGAGGVAGSRAFIPPAIRLRNVKNGTAPPQLPERFQFDITATDPFTAPAYTARTGRHCHTLSFTDLANGDLPSGSESGNIQSESDNKTEKAIPALWDIVFCSFALHLVPTSSELFALLYELSNKARWLIVIAPHKKPEIKDSWGWSRWNIPKWEAAQSEVGGEEGLELVREKTRLRLYRSSQY